MRKRYRIREGSIIDMMISSFPFWGMLLVGGLLTTITGTW